MICDRESATGDELIEALQEYAFHYPSLDPDEYTEWDTQEWFDEEIEAYAEVVGEVSLRIHRGEIREGELGRKEVWARVRARLLRVAEQGKAAGNTDEEMIVVMDDDDRSWGPKRYAPQEQRASPGECLNRPAGWERETGWDR